MFCWPCVSIYACNETNLMHYLLSVYSITIPLNFSGLLVAHHQEVKMYICDNWYVLYIYTMLPPDDGQLTRTKLIDVLWQNNLKIKSASCWFHYTHTGWGLLSTTLTLALKNTTWHNTILNYEDRSEINASCFIMWPTTSELDVGDMAVAVEPSRQYSVKFCCRATDDRRGAVWQNGVWHGSAYEVKVCNWMPPCGKNCTQWHSSTLAERLRRPNSGC
jgi:hypothetical protein